MSVLSKFKVSIKPYLCPRLLVVLVEESIAPVLDAGLQLVPRLRPRPAPDHAPRPAQPVVAGGGEGQLCPAHRPHHGQPHLAAEHRKVCGDNAASQKYLVVTKNI